MRGELSQEIRSLLLIAQKNEITEHYIYKRLAKSEKNKQNQKILNHISKDELRHYKIWKKYTKQDISPNYFKVWFYFLVSKILGITFGIKLMESGEEIAQKYYGIISKSLPLARKIEKDEHKHEQKLINLLNEEKLNYVGSIVLGLNDALVELTGALAGLTLALQNTRIVAIAGLITGIAASSSMAASEYLSTKSEVNNKRPVKAAVYTGIAYIFTVLILIFPYFIFTNLFYALGLTIFNAIVIIFLFTFYLSVAKDLSFKKRFLEMALLSLGIAAISFIIGFLIRKYIGIEV